MIQIQNQETQEMILAHITLKTSMSKFEEITSDGVPSDLQDSVAQNKSDNPECLTDSCHLETLEKKGEDIIQDGVSRKSQNTSTREILEKSSAITLHSEMPTNHSAFYTDETFEDISVEESNNLIELQNNMLQEAFNDPDFKSGETRDDSPVYSTRETSMTKLEDSKYPAETCHPEMSLDHSAYCTDEISDEESDNLDEFQDNMPDET